MANITKTQITDPIQGKIATANKIELGPEDILVFQMNRPTSQLSPGYMDAAKASLSKIIPDGKTALFIGNDIEVHALDEQAVTLLKMQGKI